MQGTDGNTGKRNSLSEEELFSLYSPDKQYGYCKERGRCVTGTAPRLGEVYDQLGEDAAIRWITQHLHDLGKYANCGYKLNEFQFKEMARMVLQNYQSLKLTEIMLFFNDCKSGKHIKLYGGFIDPMQLMGELREFVQTEIPRITSEWDEEQAKREKREGKTQNEAKVAGPKALAMTYVRKMLRNDFGDGLGPNAKKIWEMIAKGDYSGELEGFARKIDYYFRGQLTEYFAGKILRNDYVGRGGAMAMRVSEMIRTGNFTDDALGYVGRKVGDYLKAKPRQPQPAETWEETELDNEDDIIAAYADRIKREDYTGKTGANALRVFEMLGTGNFTDDWLGGIARKVGERLATDFAPTYAKLAGKGEYTGEIGARAKEIWERAREIAKRIESGDISGHWWLGEVERKVRDYLEAKDSRPSGESDSAKDSQQFEMRTDAPF